jgi:uncharacterized SAM-binding protein YcdF (DUF218 family)
MSTRIHKKIAPRRRDHRPWRRLRWMLLGCASVVAVFYLASTPILKWIGATLVRADAVEASDAIVQLAGGEGDRELETAAMFASRAAPIVVLTTGRDDPAVPELRRRNVKVERYIERSRRYLQELGVPAAAIIVLPELATSTADEANIVSAWIKTRNIKSLIIVTSAFHTRRAGYIFERTLRGTGVVIRTHPTTFDRYKPDSWWTDRNTLQTGLIEWQKTLYYRLRYW